MPNPTRPQNKGCFFKYMSPNTAKAVLGNCTLRWSSPILFNDPFDVPREMSFGITSEEIMEALSVRMIQLIESPPTHTDDLQPEVKLIVKTVKKGVPERVKKELIEGLKDVATAHQPPGKSMDELRAMWRMFIPDFRILCLAESPSHEAMWCHYGSQYTGAVFEFRCIEKLDSAWFMAKPVKYPAMEPDVYTAEGWARILTMPHEKAVRTILDISTYTESQDWSYEKEWRITSFKRPNDTGNFTDYKFHPEELAAIYLGPMITSEDSDKLCKLAQKYPKVSVWNVAIGMDREFKFKKHS